MSTPIHPIVINTFGLTDLGVVRENNEDSFLIANVADGATTPNAMEPNEVIGGDGSIFLVADGMGGGQAGEVASRMAVDLVATSFLEQFRRKRFINQKTFVRLLKGSVQEANRMVLHEGQKKIQLKGMGTTLTAAAVHGGSIFFAQLGDSRAYLLRNGCIAQMTKDQSLVAQLVATGALRPEEAKTHPRRNVILQALGVQPHVDIVMSSAALKRGDRLVICSDGLWGKVEDEEIKEFVEKFDPPTACHSLVRIARERGGEDNITIIVARFDGDGLPPATKGDAPVYQRVKENLGWWLWPRRE
jgi:serine/threonine protein phosphatase PrpC